MNLIVVTPPEIEPVSLDEMRHYLRVDVFNGVSSDDEMIAGMIQVAREAVESRTRRAYIQRRLRLVADLAPRGFPESGRCGCWGYDARRRADYLELPQSPVVQVHEVSYEGASGAAVVLDMAGLRAVLDTMPARLYLGAAQWPFDQPLRVEYTAGYPTTGSPDDHGLAMVPAAVKQAIKYEVQLQYDELPADKRKAIEDAVTRLLDTYTVHTF